VVDIQVERLEGEVALAERAGDLDELLGGGVAPAALVVAERPTRRHGNPPGQVRIALEHGARRRTAEDVVDERAAIHPEATARWVFGRQVELQAVAAVNEHAPGEAVVDGQNERYGRVQVVERRGVARGRIDVPEHLSAAGLVQAARPFPAAEI